MKHSKLILLLFVIVAEPAVVALRNSSSELFVIVAVSAVALSSNRSRPLLLIIEALPAVAEKKK